jgi:diguanylate cyclase (GGDEF)-like protein
MSAIRGFMMRHRVSLQDLSIIAAVMLVAGFLCFEIDVFTQEGLPPPEQRLELDEVLLLGALLAVSMLVFSIRRHLEQKRETTRRVAAEQHVRTMAFQDGLTGLDNRRRFEEALAVVIATPPAAGSTHAVLMLDLNGFKNINDVHGHGVGDEVLIIVAQRLLGIVAPGDTVARLGGDEFIMLARHLAGSEAAANVARHIIEALEEPIVSGKVTSRISAGIGITLIPDDANTKHEIMRKADVALYRAKAERRGAFRFFEESMDLQVRERASIEAELRVAIAAHQMTPKYHAEVDLRSGATVGFEAELHWSNPTLAAIAPERLLSIAEDCGLIHELSDCLMDQACNAAAAWASALPLSIAIVPSLLRDRQLHVRILSILATSGLNPSRLVLAVAESALVQNLEGAKLALAGLRDIGVKVSLDKFGTGYSSLYHLRNFGLDKIKIDRSFIESMHSTESSAQIVNALVGLGVGLGLAVTADGIDSNAVELAHVA